MKFNYIIISYFLTLFIVNITFGQDDCFENLANDTLLNYYPSEIDTCCGLQICYTMESTSGNCSHIFRIRSISQNQTVWQNEPVPIDTGIHFLALTLNNAFLQLGESPSYYTIDESTNTICFAMTNNDYYLYMTHSFRSSECSAIFPQEECSSPITEPNFDDFFEASEDPGALSSQNLITTEEGGLSPQDVAAMDFGDGSDGPDANTTAYILNGVVESGALQYGAGCANLNCIDVASLPDILTANSDISDYIDEEFEEEGEDYDASDVEAAVAESLAQMLEESGGLTNLINETFGLNIPDQGDCPEGEMIQNPFTSDGANKNSKWVIEKNPIEGSKNVKVMVAETTEDASLFDQSIPGLGLDGPGSATPSPSSLEMIKNVNAGVNLYNGSQSTSLPLYSVQANDITIPVSLSSTNNGLKVNDMGTLAGQNWNLEAGAAITRMIQGLPDEFLGTTTGSGRGRQHIIKPRFEMPSNTGLSVKFPGSDLCIADIPNSVLTRFKKRIFKTEGAELNMGWSPLTPNLVNFTLSIRIPIPIPFIKIFLDVGFNAGITLNQQLATINYEEEAAGFLYLGANPYGIVDMPIARLNSIPDLSDRLDVLERIHAHKKIEDASFFNEHVATFKSWKEAIEILIEGGVTRETRKIDTQPDEFYFSAGGYSGKFMFNSVGQPVFFPTHDLDIEYFFDSTGRHITKFIITTPKGMEYTFGSDNQEGVDFTRNTNYYLPNQYTYPELGNSSATSRKDFGKAEVSVAQLVQNRWIGPKKISTYGNTFERNFKIMNAPEFSSTWHLTNVRSLLSQEEVSLEYIERPNLTYYGDKTYSHTFPNFNVTPSKFITEPNTELNPLYSTDRQWMNGQAEFSLNATQIEIDRWDLVSINTQREERVLFEYEQDRGEIVGDKVCRRILVERNDQLYKGWEFDYVIESDVETNSYCEELDLPNSSAIQLEGETVWSLGDMYQLSAFEHYSYFFINFNIPCYTFPLRLNFPSIIPPTYWGYEKFMGEHSSIMHVKLLNDFNHFDKVLEDAIFSAEQKRTFLQEVREIDRYNGQHPFVTIDYEGEGEGGLSLADFPRRFHYNQDLHGYFNDNSVSGSLLPAIKYTNVINSGIITSTTSGVDKHFPFFNITSGFVNNTYQGHNENPLLNRTKLGAISAVNLATGAALSYTYESNIFPDGHAGAGIRVASMKEDPNHTNSPAKITYYNYENTTSSIINKPIRIYQNPDNYYALIDFDEEQNPVGEKLEQKVETSSGFMNRVLSNKGNIIGYGKVTEDWDGLGSSVHYFSTPDDYLERLRLFINDYPDDEIQEDRYREIKRRIDKVNNTNDDPSFDIINTTNPIPPALEYIPNLTHRTWGIGVEYQTDIFDDSYPGDGSDTGLRQRNEYEYELTSCINEFLPLNEENNNRNSPYFCTHMDLFESQMFQYNYNGNFEDNFLSQVIESFQPFGQNILGDFLDLLVGLFQEGVITNHWYKGIERIYNVSDKRIFSGNIRTGATRTTNFYEGGKETNSSSDYLYIGLEIIPSKINSSVGNNQNGDGYSESTTNIFAQPNFDGTNYLELETFSIEALNYLEEIGYTQPLLSRKLTNGEMLKGGFTALGLQIVDSSKRVIPISNWNVLSGAYSLAGKFENHNTDGKPQIYNIAEFGGTLEQDPLGFLSPIKLTWNNQLKLVSKEYQGFTNISNYDDYFELISIINEDGIITSYSYDPRGRLQTVKGLGTADIPFKQTISYEYNIGPNNNFVRTTTSFTDGLHVPQIIREEKDGYGRSTSVIRENDDALLNQNVYDHFFRPVGTYNIGSGYTTAVHEASPIPYKNTLIDAVGNETKTVQKGPEEFFSLSEITDANGHTSKNFTNAFEKVKKTVNPEGGKTLYSYDNLQRLQSVFNPNNEEYYYFYNDMGRVISEKVPGSGPKKYWYDTRYQLAGSIDAKGNGFSFHYDEFGRPTQTYFTEGATTFGAESIVEVNSINGSTLVKDNFYEQNHSWLKYSKEATFSFEGIQDNAVLTSLDIDGLGRINGSTTYYPYGKVIVNNELSDAGLLIDVKTHVISNEPVTTTYRYDYNDVLLPTTTHLSCNGIPSTLVSKLFYNNLDQVIGKGLGNSASGQFLQAIDYSYDDAGKLLTINSPSSWQCNEDDQICEFEATFTITKKCRKAIGLILNGIEVPFDSMDLSTQYNELAPILETKLLSQGLTGDVSIINTGLLVNGDMEYTITISNSNATSIALDVVTCDDSPIVFTALDCCKIKETEENVNVLSSQNLDLYYQILSYDKLDINQIELGNGCKAGKMLNNYFYDANHRVKIMENTVYNPQPIVGAYSTKYAYDAAGNILNLHRSGLTGIEEDIPQFGIIDKLRYTYEGERLGLVKDYSGNSRGFEPSISAYKYDENGNITLDTGKNLEIEYNPLNLPKLVKHTTLGNNSSTFVYTFSGEKIWKRTNSLNPEESETRVYLGGVELKDGNAEAYYFGDGRVYLSGENIIQYNIADHLGNTVVLFSDKDGDGIILTEENTESEEEVEVLQRNLYYPFGMVKEGCWNSVTNPEMNYLYNGKELEKDLGLDWSFYGFRMYDATIGRFTSVDPLAAEFPSWSSYSYTFNNPIRFIDPDGRAPDDIIVGGQTWTPGAQWNGSETDFGYQVFAALNSLVDNEVSQFSFSTNDGATHSGDALMDFVEGGRFADVDITISQGENTEALGGEISFNPNKGMMVHTAAEDNGIAPSVLLLHEFGHEWQKTHFGVENYQNPLLDDHEMSVIENLEAPAAEKLGMGVRNTHTTFDSKEEAIEMLRIGPAFQRTPYEQRRAQNTPYNYFIQTAGPNSKEPKQ